LSDGLTEEALTDGGHQCNPWPTGVRVDCKDANEQNLPGSAGCAPVGSACPASGDCPKDVLDKGTWFVTSGGTGKGTRDDPFGTIADALAVAGAGELIMVGEGDFDEKIDISSDVNIRGLCPSMTTLTLSSVSDVEKGVINIDSATVNLQDLRIGDTGALGIYANNATVGLTGVVVDGVTNHGISAYTTDLTIDVMIENAIPRGKVTARTGTAST
jgi:hypothetical protein